MSYPFLNAPAALSADAIKQDVSDVFKNNRYIQRYSTNRDAFVTLHREFDEFVMKDRRTGLEHRVPVDFTSAEDLVADWTHFTFISKANL